MVEAADSELVASGDSTPAAVGVSQWSDTWPLSSWASRGCQLRPRVSEIRGDV